MPKKDEDTSSIPTKEEFDIATDTVADYLIATSYKDLGKLLIKLGLREEQFIRPVGWGLKSCAPYYNSRIANSILPIIKAIAQDKRPRQWKEIDLDCSLKTLVLRLNQGWKYIIDNMDPTGKYQKLRQYITISINKKRRTLIIKFKQPHQILDRDTNFSRKTSPAVRTKLKADPDEVLEFPVPEVLDQEYIKAEPDYIRYVDIKERLINYLANAEVSESFHMNDLSLTEKDRARIRKMVKRDAPNKGRFSILMLGKRALIIVCNKLAKDNVSNKAVTVNELKEALSGSSKMSGRPAKASESIRFTPLGDNVKDLHQLDEIDNKKINSSGWESEEDLEGL